MELRKFQWKKLSLKKQRQINNLADRQGGDFISSKTSTVTSTLKLEESDAKLEKARKEVADLKQKADTLVQQTK